jgi:para-aminobenzoate synthetase component 1
MRLGEDETHVFATASATVDGWGNTLSWNPAVVFSPEIDDIDVVVSQLEDFVNSQNSLGRLVAGYETYDFGCLLKGITPSKVDGLGMPLVFAASFSSWIAFDDRGATVHYDDSSFVSEVKEIIKRSRRPIPVKTYKKVLSPVQSRAWYNQAYSRIKDYIKQGDIYQVNLTHQLVGSTSLSGRDLFCLLHQTSKADFQSYVEVDGSEIMSFSPERFVKIKDRLIITSPIKGTRARGATVQEDETLRSDLLNSPKERAELNMITDLLRNDLGEICEVGSVDVVQQRTLKAYSTLWHAHSTIKGTLRPGISSIGALTSLMPGGSITGCPKKRAIEIIDELEATQRGIYTGSIFVVKPDGTLDSNIAIRTMVKSGERLYLSVGGGIVNDSIQKDEYRESIDKAVSFMNAVTTTSDLSSDVLERQFGLTTVDILHQDGKSRAIRTKVTVSGQVLELSMVEFIKFGVNKFPDVHLDVLSGQSMGKAFKARGIKFTRKIESSYRYALPDSLNRQFGSSKPAWVMNVSILVGPDRTPYARILETYSPEVKWTDLGGRPTDEELKKLQGLSKFL